MLSEDLRDRILKFLTEKDSIDGTTPSIGSAPAYDQEANDLLEEVTEKN